VSEPADNARPRLSGALVAAGVFLVATCLRPAITSVGPLLGQIGAAEGLGESALGWLGALPLLAFAAVSPLVSRFAARVGAELAVLVALGVLAAGMAVRSWTGPAGLWLGTAVVGAAIAVGNVLVPALVRRDHPRHVSQATGGYSAALVLAAATASALAVPIAAATDWRFALAVWAIPTLVVAALWLPRVRVAAAPEPGAAPRHAGPSVWRQPMAWLVTAFMGLQSTTFYVTVTWLPSIEAAAGIPADVAGVHLFVFQGVGILAGLAIPLLMHRPHSQVAAAVVSSVPMAVGVVGLLLAPALVVLWVVVAGLGSGASLVVALALVSLRGRSHHETARLSGMAQSVGYLFAAAGPIVAGLLAERTGSWTASVLLVAALATVQVLVGALVGRDRARPA
jgi:CP family cyanate transporter-like MFS transporter